jgi:bacterioferritin
MDKKKVIQLLNEAIEAEHGAIIQYLNHAFAIGEGDLACEIEAISREEMRHLDWLAETVVGLGGEPSLTRGKTNLAGKTPPVWMKNNVLAEEEAIAMYRHHITAIDEPQIKRLLQRILSDELSHHKDFTHFVDKVKEEKLKDVRGTRSDEMTKTLNWGIEHEYTVVLQYMYQSYYTKNKEAKKQLEDQAVNEMQHMGWLAEKLIDAKSGPVLEHAAVEATGKSVPLADMLKADIKIEDYVAARYEKGAKETAEPKVKRLLERLRDHELYHSQVFGEILRGEKK